MESSTGGRRSKTLAWVGAAAAAAAAVAGAVALVPRLKRVRRAQRCREVLDRWLANGTAKEPVIDCEVPVKHGMGSDAPDTDVVEVPVGLVFECERLRAELAEHLLGSAAREAADSDELDALIVEALRCRWPDEDPSLNAEADADLEADDDSRNPQLQLPWLDVEALAQLTYWYDRRPQGEEVAPVVGEAEAASAAQREEARKAKEEDRPSDAKFGRWTKKVTRQKVVYGTVALRYRTRGHLGQQVFRRPAGIDITRLATLSRAAALCGHEPLLDLVKQTMEQLQPKNVAHIPWAEVKKHTEKDDTWLLIDGKVYDVSPFLDLHPGGGTLIVEAAGTDSTALFEQTHGEGLRYSLRLLNQFFIGICDGGEEAEPARAEIETSPEFLQTLRSVTGALHTFDEAKATGEAFGLAK